MNQPRPRKCEGCGIPSIVHISGLDRDMLCTTCEYRSDTELRVWDGYARYADKSTQLFRDTIRMCHIANTSTLEMYRKIGG